MKTTFVEKWIQPNLHLKKHQRARKVQTRNLSSLATTCPLLAKLSMISGTAETARWFNLDSNNLPLGDLFLEGYPLLFIKGAFLQFSNWKRAEILTVPLYRPVPKHDSGRQTNPHNRRKNHAWELLPHQCFLCPTDLCGQTGENDTYTHYEHFPLQDDRLLLRTGADQHVRIAANTRVTLDNVASNGLTRAKLRTLQTQIRDLANLIQDYQDPQTLDIIRTIFYTMSASQIQADLRQHLDFCCVHQLQGMNSKERLFTACSFTAIAESLARFEFNQLKRTWEQTSQDDTPWCKCRYDRSNNPKEMVLHFAAQLSLRIRYAFFNTAPAAERPPNYDIIIARVSEGQEHPVDWPLLLECWTTRLKSLRSAWTAFCRCPICELPSHNIIDWPAPAYTPLVDGIPLPDEVENSFNPITLIFALGLLPAINSDDIQEECHRALDDIQHANQVPSFRTGAKHPASPCQSSTPRKKTPFRSDSP